MYDFVYPMAGMFLWLHARFETHPLYNEVDHERLFQALWVLLTTEPYRVLLAPGQMFSPTPEIAKEKGWQYYRLCFAAVDDNVIKKYSESTVAAFRHYWTIDDPKEIDKILNRMVRQKPDSSGSLLRDRMPLRQIQLSVDSNVCAYEAM